MSLAHGTQEVTAVYIGQTAISQIYVGTEFVWQALDTSWQQAGLSKTLTVPKGAAYMDLIALGGGGGGGGSNANFASTPGSSGRAGAFAAALWNVTPGTTFTVTIGSAGAAGAAPNGVGGAGGSTTVTMTGQTSLTAAGGRATSNVTNNENYRDPNLVAEIPGDYTYTLGGTPHTFSGGTPAAGKGTTGPWPGGAGGGGVGAFMSARAGSPGASGIVWYRFRAY